MIKHKHATSVALVYFLNISVVVILFYSFRVSFNSKKASDLKDVYYGVQFAYCAIICVHVSMFFLNVHLAVCVYKDDISWINLWTVGFLALLALEAVLTIYSNILRDHVNKKFDELCEHEVAFFFVRFVLNVVALRSVTTYANRRRAERGGKGAETILL